MHFDGREDYPDLDARPRGHSEPSPASRDMAASAAQDHLVSKLTPRIPLHHGGYDVPVTSPGASFLICNGEAVLCTLASR